MSVQSIALILEMSQSIAKDMFKHLGPGMINSFLVSRTMKIGLWVLHPPTSHEGFFYVVQFLDSVVGSYVKHCSCIKAAPGGPESIT